MNSFTFVFDDWFDIKIEAESLEKAEELLKKFVKKDRLNLKQKDNGNNNYKIKKYR